MNSIYKRSFKYLFFSIVSLILVEGLLRVNFIQDLFPVDIQKEILSFNLDAKKSSVNHGMPHHPDLHHFWGRNVRTGHDDKRYGPDFKFETNNDGWLVDHEIQSPKPKNTYRIFYLGDSNTQGIMARGLNLTNLIEKRLQTKYPNVEVINTGTSSYSTLIYYILLKKYVLKYEPDLIVINFDMTDVGNDLHYMKRLISDKDGNPLSIIPEDTNYSNYILTPIGPILLSKEKLETKNKYYKFFINKTMTGKYIYAIERQNYKKNEVEFYYDQSTISTDANGAWTNFDWTNAQIIPVNYSMSILEKIFNLSKQNGIDVILSTSPNQDQINGKSSSRPFDTLEEIANKNNIKFINTYKEFINKYSLNELNSFYFDHEKDHLNAKGNKAWADLQYPIIESYIKNSEVRKKIITYKQ